MDDELHDNGDTVFVDDSVVGQCISLAHMRRSRKLLDKNIADAEAKIKAAIGMNAGIANADGRVLATYKSSTVRRLDQKSLAKDFPDLVEAYKTEATNRILLLKELDDL